jgi:aspartate/methionine/tyrosine aminotransferase
MPADRVSRFSESIIREMTRLSLSYGGLNLSQGFPDFPAPPEVKEAACRAIMEEGNQYSVTWGIQPLRQAIAEKMRAYNGVECDPDAEITVTCGAAEALLSAMLGHVNPGEEVVIFEPYFETYVPDVLLCGATPVFVPLHEPEFRFDPGELRRAFGPKTRAVIINTPHNPSGHVFDRQELAQIAELCLEHDALAITDEIYEYILYDGRRHVSIGSLPGMADRTITISGMSKTFSVTGWRLGYAVAVPRLTEGIRKVHDYAVVCAPRPLQEAALVALKLPATYYASLREGYQRRRDLMQSMLERAGFSCRPPEGAYYTLASFAGIAPDLSDRDFVERMAATVGVIAVPGSAFYEHKALGQHRVRFAFSKRDDTLRDAGERLLRLRDAIAAASLAD